MVYTFKLDLHPTQLEVYSDPHKHKVVAAGKGWGKTNLVTKSGASIALTRPKSCGAIIAPFAKQAHYDYNFIQKLIPKKYIEKTSERWMTFSLTNGSDITMFSGENPDAIRGFAWDWVIVEEAAFCCEEVVDITDSQIGKRSGIAWYISTPNGKGHFYDLYCQELKDPLNYKSFHFTTYDNPHYPVAEIERMKLKMTEIAFRQEIMAEFLEGGIVFPYLSEIMTSTPRLPQPGHDYVNGVDLANINDFVVIKTFDKADNHEVAHQRITSRDWSYMRSIIYSSCKYYNNADLIIDKTGVGASVVEDLQKMVRAYEKGADGSPEAPRQGYLTIVPIAFSSKTKPELFTNYIMMQANRTIHLLPIPESKQEHEDFMTTKTATGYTQYHAAKGRHDDCVMAAALAAWGLDKFGGSVMCGPYTETNLKEKKPIDPSKQIDVEDIIVKMESRQITGMNYDGDEQNILQNYEDPYDR